MSGAKGFYTASEAARIAKVPRSTVDYWAETDLVVPTQRKARPRLYSFEDLRDLVVANTLREQGAGVRDQRAALAYVREVGDTDRLAKANFAVYEGELVYVQEEDGRPVAPHKRGQYFLRMREVFDALGVEGDELTVLYPAERITIDPEVRGGTPVIQGTRIPAALIAEMSTEGVPDDEIMAAYPSLSLEDIRAAVAWTERADTGERAETG